MDKNYVVVIGNMVKIVGPFTWEEANEFAETFDPGSDNYITDSEWDGYSVSIEPLSDRSVR